MSSDQIFAAQMWTWPDPMIKRGPTGDILVVNAAFLGLYGGSVESWTGQLISGWPSPQPSGQVSRFESRIPQSGDHDTVYDWVENTLQDGTALAMARNVSSYAYANLTNSTVMPNQDMPSNTALGTAPTPVEKTSIQAAAPAPSVVKPADINMNAVNSAAPTAAIIAGAGGAAIATAAALTQTETFQSETSQLEESAPVMDANVVAEVSQQEVEPVKKPQFEASQSQLSQTQTFKTAAPEGATQTAATEQPAVQNASVQNETQERDFERRALPIEDGSAILGNNWRDAVIAKAVGVTPETEKVEGQDANPTQNSEDTSGAGTRILLAEDNAINALLTRTLLEAEGCEVDVVEDGALSVEAMKNNSYDMIFMDMRMPNMDGLEATRKIRAMGHGADELPIVALTANAFDDDRNACFDSGMNDFMTKPVSAEELSLMVSTHTQKRSEKIAS